MRRRQTQTVTASPVEIMHKSILVIGLSLFACALSDESQAAERATPAPIQIPIWLGTPPDAQPAPGPQTDWTNIVRPTIGVLE